MTRRSSTWLGRLLPAFAACFAIAGVCVAAWPHVIDDAFIVLRYARNIAGGDGYAFNPGSPSDGVTGPLWLLAPIAAHALGLDARVVTQLVGALCACACAFLAVAWAGKRALGARGAWICALALGTLPDVGCYAVSGLETPLAMLALVVHARGALARRARPWHCALATIALAWLRPELAPCVIVLWIALVSRARDERQALWRAGALAAAGIAALLAFRLTLFGDVVPLSARAKPADLARGLRYVAIGIALWTSLAGALLAVAGARLGHARERWLGGAVLVHVIAVALAGGDWMPGARLLVPLAPLYALLVAAGAVRVGLRRPRLAVCALAIACSVPLLDLATRMPELRASGESRERNGRPLASWLRAHAKRVALLDAGFLGYTSGLPVVDLGGLTDPYVARLRGGHIDKRIDEAFLRARDPDAIVVHSTVDPRGSQLAISSYPVEERVLHMPWVRERFELAHVVRYAPSYWYAVLIAKR